MSRPELKQFGDVTPADFERHPAWIGCHTADYDEAWYGETDEVLTLAFCDVFEMQGGKIRRLTSYLMRTR